MRRNLLRERLDGSDVLVGIVLPFRAPDAVEFCRHLGFDWILIDGEHGGVGVETSYTLVTAADAVELASVVRVPANDPAVILGYAETGANAILAPHIQSAAAGAQLVQAVRYAPEGSRGAMSGSRAANYGLTQTSAEYFAAVDRQAIPIGMIEDKQALDDLEEIVRVRGLDHFFIGPGDLAMSLGLPGMAFDPRVQDEVSRAVKVISGAGKTVGTLVNNIKAAERSIADGARMLTISLGGLVSPAAQEFLKGVRQLHVA